jgi:integrase
MKLVASGVDPSDTRKTDRVASMARAEAARLADAGLPGRGTFEHVATEWLSTIREAKVSEGHSARTRIRLVQDIFPWLGRRQIGEIEAPELLVCLRRVEARGAIETAHRIKDSCAQVFRFGIATGQCSRNPAADLRDALRPVQGRHHAAVTDPIVAGQLLRDMMAYQGTPITRSALSLTALLLLRPGELRHMEWGWLDLNDGMLLTIPAEVMKRTKTGKANGRRTWCRWRRRQWQS